MPRNHTPMPDLDPLTDQQRAAVVKVIETDKTVGLKDALRRTGITGTGGQLSRLISQDDDLRDQTRKARGWDINRVETTTWEVAADTTHPSWDRANARILKAYGGAHFRDQHRVELTGNDGGPIVTEDRSASLADIHRVLDEAGALDPVDGSGTAGGEMADA